MTETTGVNAHIGELTNSKIDRKPGNYYIINTLVPERDGSRILGPLIWEDLERNREKYTLMARQMGGEFAAQHPFVAYHYGRTFVQIE